ncbi:MAG TPA: hypothetical protein PLI47_00860 [Bacteroidia bacterium]|mgnify:FL=1|nr:hypothetical protein [Bacteroidota bacterium]MBK7572076.1 hypothetical protein [Bacteroidota bacterium]HQW21822.1 hypothetical protein [Bacteroidia bacterium]
MEQTYLYYPARKVHRILSTLEAGKKGFRVVFSDPEEMSLIFRKENMFKKKKFFEVKVTNTDQENIACVKVSQIYTDKPNNVVESDLIQVILKVF